MSSTAGSVGTAAAGSAGETTPQLTPTSAAGNAAPPADDNNQPVAQQPSTPTAGAAATSTEDTPVDSFLFASESVTESHPDKLCDTISDAIVDACLTLDPSSRVACETVCKTGVVIIFGEITTSASINYEQVIRDAVRDAGYDDPAKGLDYKTCNVIVALEEQSPDIAQSVDSTKVEDMGAGDSSVVFG